MIGVQRAAGFLVLVFWTALVVHALVNPASCLGDCGGVFLAGAAAWVIGLAWLVVEVLARSRRSLLKE